MPLYGLQTSLDLVLGLRGAVATAPWYTTGKLDGVDPNLWLDFVNDCYAINGAPVTRSALTFSRASAGTRTGPTGLVETIAVNTMRLDYATNGAPLGVLLEEQRTNIIRQNDFDALSNWATWQGVNASQTLPNATTAPDGTNTAYKMIDVNGETRAFWTYTFGNLPLGVSATFSVFAKAAEYNYLNIFTVGSTPTASFNLSTGVVDNYGTAATVVMIPYPNGWYRCCFTVTPNIQFSDRFGISLTGNNKLQGKPTYTGTGGGVYLWGFQDEIGFSASSYIPTTTAAVTRATDNLSIPTAAWYNAVQNTSYVSSRINYLDPIVNQYMYSLDNGATSDRYTQWYNPTQLNTIIAAAAVTVYNPSAITLPVGLVHKTALTAQLNDFIGAYDGTLQAAGASGAMPTGLTNLVIGAKFDNGNTINGWVQEFRHYPIRALNASIQALTV